MAAFQYSATNKAGKMVTGQLDAANRDAAREALTRQELHPILLKETKPKSSFFSLSKPGKIKQKDLVIFTRQLSTMISAGVSLTKALATLQLQSDSKNFKAVISVITKDVEGGMPLADAFAKHPRAFSEIYINMVRAGEAGGILDDILKRLAKQVESEASMRKKIKSASMYPIVILCITVIAFFGIMLFVMPKIGKIIKDISGPEAKLPVYSQAMLSISDFTVKNWYLVIGGLVLVVYGVRRYIKTPKGKYVFHGLLLKVPVFKTIFIKIAIARFARTFASLMGAGVGVLDALEVTGGAIGNKVIEAELHDAAKAVKNGKQLSEPLSKSKHFPMIISQMIAVGEETGQIDTILVKVAEFYEEEVEATIDGLSSIIEPLMIMVLGSMVGLIAASVMGPISSMGKGINSSN